MKKLLILILVIAFILGSLTINLSRKESTSINDKLIRFHVIANSDLNEDQAVKLKVRDAILSDVGPKLSKSSSREESLKILQANLGKIESISNKILSKEGQNYRAQAMLGDFNFPIKKYGTITLPAGEYKAVRVVLGDGEGKNWWCVMFPPLCFIDITRGLTSEKTDEELKEVLEDEEVEAITAFKQESQNKEVKTDKKISESQEIIKSAIDKNKSLNTQSEDIKPSKKSEVFSTSVEFRYKSLEVFAKAFSRFKDAFK
jgi:stage II sporulation protein R